MLFYSFWCFVAVAVSVGVTVGLFWDGAGRTQIHSSGRSESELRVMLDEKQRELEALHVTSAMQVRGMYVCACVFMCLCGGV